MYSIVFDFLVDFSPLQDQAYLIQFMNKRINVLAGDGVYSFFDFCTRGLAIVSSASRELSYFVVEGRNDAHFFPFVMPLQVSCRFANTPSRKPACCIAGKLPLPFYHY